MIKTIPGAWSLAGRGSGTLEVFGVEYSCIRNIVVLGDSLLSKRRDSSIQVNFRSLPPHYPIYTSAVKEIQEAQGPIRSVASQSSWILAAGVNRESLVQELRRKGLEANYKIAIEFEDGVPPFAFLDPHSPILGLEEAKSDTPRDGLEPLEQDIQRVRSLSNELASIEQEWGEGRGPLTPTERVPVGGGEPWLKVALHTDVSLRDIYVSPTAPLVETIRAKLGLPPGVTSEPALVITTPQGRRLDGLGTFASYGVKEGDRLAVRIDSLLGAMMYDIT